MQRSLTATDVNFLSLRSAIFCVQCELLSENNTPRCLGCGSGADPRRGGCRGGNSSEPCCRTLTAAANPYPEVGRTSARRSAEDQAMNYKRLGTPTSSANPLWILRRGRHSTDRRDLSIRTAASVGGLCHDSLDNGPRGAWSSPPVR